MSYTYSALALDAAGDPIAGRLYEVYTAENGTRIPGIVDLMGSGTAGYATSADSPKGKLRWSINSDSWPAVWLKAPTGDWWGPIVAEEVAGQVPDAVANASAALAAANEATTMFGEITRSLSQFASPSQLDGTQEFNSALQEAIDSGAHAITMPVGAVLKHGGTFVDISARKKLRLDFFGTTVIRTSSTGTAVLLLDRYNGLGYGAGVEDLIIENGHFRGSFTASAPIQVLGTNHGRRIRVRNCVLVACMVQGFHAFELDGVEDVVFEDLTVYGYKNDGVSAARTETVNIDCSQVGAGATVAPYGDGLPCRDVHIVRGRFLPWTDPDTGTKYPAPIPIGTHGSREGSVHENITVDVYVEDPPVDEVGGSFTLATDEPYHRGLIHIPSCRGVKVRARVKVTAPGTGSIRVVMLQGAATGVLASSDPNSTATSGAFTTPNPCEYADIDVRVEGMDPTPAVENPHVYVTGVTARPARDIRVRVSSDGGGRGAYIRRTDSGVIDGDFLNVTTPYTLSASTGVKLGPMLA